MIDIVYTKEDVVKEEAVEWQYADVIQQHVDPIQLKEKNILIAIKEDATCWGRWAKEESSVWMQLTDGQFSKSILSKRMVHLTIREGVLSGCYVLTDDGKTTEQRVAFCHYIECLKTSLMS